LEGCIGRPHETLVPQVKPRLTTPSRDAMLLSLYKVRFPATQRHHRHTHTHTHQRVGCSEFATTRHSHGLVGCTRRRLGMIAQHWKMVSTAWSCVTLTYIRVLTPLYGFRPARLRTCRRTAERDVAAIVSDRNLVTSSTARHQCPFDKTTRQLM